MGVSSLLSACIGTTSEDLDPSPDPSEPPWSIEYVCGPGHDIQFAPGCHGRLWDPSMTLGEPQGALHPTDRDVFAIAVSDGRRPDAALGDVPYADARGIAVHITQDGGETFTRHAIPLQDIGDLPYNPVMMGADPAVAFTPDGVLHLTGLILEHPSGSGLVHFEASVFYMTTPDLGATWSAPVVLDDAGYNDRDWLATSVDGEAFVSWREHDAGGSKVTGGDSIDGSDPLVLDGCGQISNVAWLDQVPLVACLVGDGDLEILELDGSGATTRGTAAGACPSNSARLASSPTGALAASCYYGTLTASLDGGRNWSKPVDVFALTTVDDDWPPSIGPNIFGMGADPRGMVHLTLTPFPSTQHTLPLGDGRPVAHVVLDPVSMELVHEVELQAEAPGEGPAWAGIADDFYSIDFVGPRGLLVWTSPDWGTHYAIVEFPV